MAERRTSSILLIVPFFGSLPPWSELYFRSCAANPTVNWLLVSDHVFDQGSLPPNVRSVMEIIINGKSLAAIVSATQAAIHASKDTPGLLRISAGNYGGRLDKSFVYLHPEKQPSDAA